MKVNYHTHTYRCNHAAGTEREYIEAAIAGGFTTLGFADHAPMPFPGEYYSGFRMKLHQAQEYFETIRALKEEYRKEIEILVGFEAEYYPDVFDDFLAFVQPLSPDYLIMGQHFLHNEENAPWASRPTEDPALLRQYVDQTIAGLSTGRFLYHAHPDMMRFVGDAALYEEEMTRLCTFCKQQNIPLEINLLGLMENRWYPRGDFWGIAGRIGNNAIIGFDAHRPDVLADKELYQKGRQWAEKFGVVLLDGLDL